MGVHLLQNYGLLEQCVWSSGSRLSCPEGPDYTLKLVLAAEQFYDTVCGYKTLEYRSAKKIVRMLLTNNVKRIMLYSAFAKVAVRPYILKKYEGCVKVGNGIRIKYPRVEVISKGLTYCIKLGDTLEYFNPLNVDAFAWEGQQGAVCVLD